MKKNKTKVKRRREEGKRVRRVGTRKPTTQCLLNVSRFSVSFGVATILVVGGSYDRHRSIAEPQYRIIRSAQNKLRIKKRQFTLIA
jgi:hypothetical protein